MTGRLRASVCALLVVLSTSGCGLDVQQRPERIPQEQLPSPLDGTRPDVPAPDE